MYLQHNPKLIQLSIPELRQPGAQELAADRREAHRRTLEAAMQPLLETMRQKMVVFSWDLTNKNGGFNGILYDFMGFLGIVMGFYGGLTMKNGEIW
jgi:hypothetical protein